MKNPFGLKLCNFKFPEARIYNKTKTAEKLAIFFLLWSMSTSEGKQMFIVLTVAPLEIKSKII